MRQIVLDTETTGLKFEEGHRIIEIGCLELINRKLTGKQFHYYLNPEREIDEAAIAVHGIKNEFLKNKPLFSAIANDFLQFIAEDELIIHNAPFDLGFINNELRMASAHYKNIQDMCRVVDTLKLARQLHTGQRNSLDALCKRYNIDNSERDLHGALLDAHLLSQVYLAMTGGQGSLFEELLQDTVATITQQQKKAIKRDNFTKLPIIHANETEQAEHEKFLQLLKSKGKVLWEE